MHQLPAYLCSLLTQKPVCSLNLRSHGQILYQIPRTRSAFGERAFSVYAPTSWTEIQAHFKLDHCISLDNFKTIIKDHLTSVCTCFIN